MKKREDYSKDFQDEYRRWEYLKDHGGSDPFWPDGCNMNLVRNHIIYLRKEVEENLSPGEYPEEYFKDLPHKVEEGYMVNPDLIRKRAREQMAFIEENEDYKYMRKERQNENKKNAILFKPVATINGLKDFIKSDNLVEMRRINAEYYISWLRGCRKKYEETKTMDPEELHLGQLTIWDFMNA